MAKKEADAKKSKSNFFREMKSELKKVVWPTKKELINNTSAVIAFVVIIAIIVFMLDFCFDLVNKYGIVKLQETVQTSLQSDSNIISNSEENIIEENTEDNGETESEVQTENADDNQNSNSVE